MINRSLLFTAVIAFSSFTSFCQLSATRPATQDVNAAQSREQPGLLPGDTMLFNGWGMTPAGQSVPISDMPLKMLMAPDGKCLLAVSGGFNGTGLTLLDPKEKRATQFFPLRECWNGVAFTRDGKHILVTGSGFGKLHIFDYANGTAKFDRTVQLARGSTSFFAAIVVHPVTGKIYICNEGAHEILVVNPRTYRVENLIPVGQHPHTCAFGIGNSHLYVSNWGSRSVSVIDLKTNKRLRDFSVGLRPNDMTLAPDGRLFVACAGYNSVHVIDTRPVEK